MLTEIKHRVPALRIVGWRKAGIVTFASRRRQAERSAALNYELESIRVTKMDSIGVDNHKTEQLFLTSVLRSMAIQSDWQNMYIIQRDAGRGLPLR
jgi:hypothetical protein